MGMDLVDKMLLRIPWDEGIRRWRHLDGHEHKVDELTTRLPAAAPVLSAYASYLYMIGEAALPKAFMVVANQIEAGDAKRVTQRWKHHVLSGIPAQAICLRSAATLED